MVSFYGYPKAHRRHLRTTKVIESPFAAEVTDGRSEAIQGGSEPHRGDRKMLLVAETKFRKLNAPELLQDVWEGAEYRDGARVEYHQERYAA